MPEVLWQCQAMEDILDSSSTQASATVQEQGGEFVQPIQNPSQLLTKSRNTPPCSSYQCLQLSMRLRRTLCQKASNFVCKSSRRTAVIDFVPPAKTSCPIGLAESRACSRRSRRPVHAIREPDRCHMVGLRSSGMRVNSKPIAMWNENCRRIDAALFDSTHHSLHI